MAPKYIVPHGMRDLLPKIDEYYVESCIKDGFISLGKENLMFLDTSGIYMDKYKGNVIDENSFLTFPIVYLLDDPTSAPLPVVYIKEGYIAIPHFYVDEYKNIEVGDDIGDRCKSTYTFTMDDFTLHRDKRESVRQKCKEGDHEDCWRIFPTALLEHCECNCFYGRNVKCTIVHNVPNECPYACPHTEGERDHYCDCIKRHYSDILKNYYYTRTNCKNIYKIYKTDNALFSVSTLDFKNEIMECSFDEEKNKRQDKLWDLLR